jgi:hypothetical protein
MPFVLDWLRSKSKGLFCDEDYRYVARDKRQETRIDMKEKSPGNYVSTCLKCAKTKLRAVMCLTQSRHNDHTNFCL